MSARGVLRELSCAGLAFWCPGCNEYHTVNIGPGSPSWTFNGDYDAPTFEPSVLVRSGHYVPSWSGKACWCSYNKEHPDDPERFECTMCHSFVRNGMIQFLSDCTHALAGQTVKLGIRPGA